MDRAIEDAAKRYLPGPLLRVVRLLIGYGRWARGQFLAVGDHYGIVSPDRIYSESYYEKRTQAEHIEVADTISEALDDEFGPTSVIDFGCAVGNHLKHFHEQGADVRGVEGSRVALENSTVPRKLLEQHDLREPYEPDARYDLSICFEVLEHIPARYADTVVESIARSGRVAVVSAAPPGQGTVKDHHHVNEREASYWISKFEQAGMGYDRETSERLRRVIEVPMSPIPDNLLVFRQAGANA